MKYVSSQKKQEDGGAACICTLDTAAKCHALSSTRHQREPPLLHVYL